MKATELMVGDWVLYKDDICIVDEIRVDNTVVLTALNTDVTSIDGDQVSVDEITPIPLTPEILEKNGFVKYKEVSDTPPYDKDEEGNMYYSYKGEQKFWGWWQPNNVYLIPVNAMVDLEIKFVHQLQHALRLCGINKEITI